MKIKRKKDHRNGIEITVKNLRPAGIFSKVLKSAKETLKEEGISSCDLTIIFVKDDLIRRLNKKYLQKTSSTDVLAFDLRFENSDSRLVGDIIISLDTAKLVSKKLNIDLAEELCRYVIHGILHLCGYDDHRIEDRKKMWKRQEYLVRKAKVNSV